MNPQIKAIIEAAKQLGLAHKEVNKDGFISINVKGQDYYFIVNETPLNSSMAARIAADKAYTHELLHDVIRMPKTEVFIDPNGDERYEDYMEEDSYREIGNRIAESFELPLIIKKNSGANGIHVFLCSDSESIQKAVKKVFNKKSRHYDHVLLAQQYVKTVKELRAIVLKGEVKLLYEKARTRSRTDLQKYDEIPAEIVNDHALLERVQEFIEPIYTKLDLQYGGLDIAIDEHDQLYFFEINTRPGYKYFVKHNGLEPVIELFKEVLENL